MWMAATCRTKKEIYYHFGLDMGGSEGLVDVVSATEGIVTSSGNDVLAGQAAGRAGGTALRQCLYS